MQASPSFQQTEKCVKPVFEAKRISTKGAQRRKATQGHPFPTTEGGLALGTTGGGLAPTTKGAPTTKRALAPATKWLALALLMWGGAGWAQPRMSIHPLMTEHGPRGKRWNALFMQEVAKQNIDMTPEDVVGVFLEPRGGSCKNDDNCLSELGQSTRAHYILITSMFRNGDTYTLSARIVQSGRNKPEDSLIYKTVGPIYVERISRVVEDNNARAAYERLFAELKLGALVAHPDWPLRPPTIVEKRVVETIEKESRWVLTPTGTWVRSEEFEKQFSGRASGMRISAYTLFGVAAASGISAAIFAGLADDNFRAYKNSDIEMDGVVLSGREAEAKKWRNKVTQQKTIAYVGTALAGAALAGGIVLFMLSPERAVAKAKRVQVGVGPLGGAVLSIEGTF